MIFDMQMGGTLELFFVSSDFPYGIVPEQPPIEINPVIEGGNTSTSIAITGDI